jgi:hemoglobin-like flavoprotein
LSPETIAIIEASAPDIQGRRAAIIFSAWHHLEAEPARRLLFEQFTLDGDVVGVLEAVVATVRQGHWSGSAPFSPPQVDLGWFEAALESALIRAIKEVLNASTAVLNAWREAFRFFTGQLVPALKV